METIKFENLNDSNCTERYIKKHYYEWWEYITNHYPLDLKWGEKLYWYFNNINERPKCKMCDKPVKFLSFRRGYQEFCSYKCMNSCSDIQERKKQTCLEHFGTEVPMQSKQIQDKIKKTCLERYGVDNVFKKEGFQDNLKKKNQEKYGVDYYVQTKECQDKIKNTLKKRYGVEHNTQIDFVRNRMSLRWNEELMQRDPYIIEIRDGIVKRRCSDPHCNLCKEKQYDIIRYLHNSRFNHGQEICPIKNPVGIVGKNTDIEIFVKNILDKYNIEYQTNKRNIIPPKELDIYIPSKNMAIECNGTYWHSDIYKDQFYHYNKFNECEIKGIQLISIWYDYIKTEPKIVESIILSKLGIYKKRIYARKCEIKEVEAKKCNKFLNENHLQGSCPSSIKLGLYYEGNLVAVMTFGKKRIGIGNTKNEFDYELVRFCNKRHFQIVGGAGKLFKYFIKQYNPQIVISFSSNDISNGNLYNKLGFKKESETKGSYWYIEPNTNKRYHRFKFRKSELIKMGADPNKSESEIMRDSKYLKIYDSGQKKWVYKI